MKIYVNVKQAGTRKNYIAKQEINLKTKPATLRDLIAGVVEENVKEFNNSVEGQRILAYLTSEEIEDKLTLGRVSFGEVYNQKKASLAKALQAAFSAYEDGIYRVFIDDIEAGELDDRVEINEGDVLTLIRLTMLAGRMW